jgi:hypothetical protein
LKKENEEIFMRLPRIIKERISEEKIAPGSLFKGDTKEARISA